MSARSLPALLVLLAVAIPAPFFIGSDYNVTLLVTTVVVALAALSLDIVIGHMGQFSFGHAAFWGIGAYASAKFSLNLHVPIVFALLIATALSGAAGLAVGYVVLRRNRGLELAMVTLGFGAILLMIALSWYSFTGGEVGVVGLPPLALFGWSFESPLSQYFFVLVVLLIVIYGHHRVTASRFGRAVHSLRESEYLAVSVGIPVVRYYAFAFAGACALAGLAGALYGETLGYVSPDFFNITYMFEFLIIVMIGGAGTIGGPIIGSVVYIWANAWAQNLSQSLRLLIFGVILLGVSLFLPRGIYPTARSLIANVVGRYPARRSWTQE